MKYKIKNISKKKAYIKLYNKIYIQSSENSSFESSENSSLESSEHSSFERLDDSLDKLRFAIIGQSNSKPLLAIYLFAANSLFNPVLFNSLREQGRMLLRAYLENLYL